MIGPKERRRLERRPVHATGVLTEGGLRRTVEVRDLSAGGVRAELGSRGLPIGTRVYLRLPRYGLRLATVMWAADGSAGLQFLEPLPMRRSWPPGYQARADLQPA